jgi:hypothetical protein
MNNYYLWASLETLKTKKSHFFVKKSKKGVQNPKIDLGRGRSKYTVIRAGKFDFPDPLPWTLEQLLAKSRLFCCFLQVFGPSGPGYNPDPFF